MQSVSADLSRWIQRVVEALVDPVAIRAVLIEAATLGDNVGSRRILILLHIFNPSLQAGVKSAVRMLEKVAQDCLSYAKAVEAAEIGNHGRLLALLN